MKHRPQALFVLLVALAIAGETCALCIIHFNDVYQIGGNPGAARFGTAIANIREQGCQDGNSDPLILFSGDGLSPSPLTSHTGGAHMIAAFNAFNITAACPGNHDYDDGLANFKAQIHKSVAPWYVSNLFEPSDGTTPLAGTRAAEVIDWNGTRVGIMGLVEDWFDSVSAVDKSEYIYQDFVTRGRQVAKELRDAGAEFVIAITHMEHANDEKLAREVPEIDLVAGGHNHDYFVRTIGRTKVLNSGTDFQDLSEINVQLGANAAPLVAVTRHRVNETYKRDAAVSAALAPYMTILSHMDEPLTLLSEPWDAQRPAMRTGESPLGNLVADSMRDWTRADIAVWHGGIARSDVVHSGIFSRKDLHTLMPYESRVAVVQVTGEQVLEALENSVSSVSCFDGRFLQVSGLRFSFDPHATVGTRVTPSDVWLGNMPLDLQASYSLACTSYVLQGKSGFTMLKQSPEVLDDIDTHGPLLKDIVQHRLKSTFWAKDSYQEQL